MNADDRHSLIERYLSGSMDSTEVGAFAARLEHDPELRRMLAADRVITDAVSRDRALTPPAATVPGASLLASLDASRRVTPFHRSPFGGWLSGSSLAIIAIIGALGILAGTLFVAPILQREADAPSMPGRAAEPRSTLPGVRSHSAPAIAAPDDAQPIVAEPVAPAPHVAAPDATGRESRADDHSAGDRAVSARPSSARAGSDAARSDEGRASETKLPEFDDTTIKAEITVKGTQTK
jgi:hypothetical protein